MSVHSDGRRGPHRQRTEREVSARLLSEGGGYFRYFMQTSSMLPLEAMTEDATSILGVSVRAKYFG